MTIDDIANIQADQAARLARVIHRWLGEAPGRSVTLTRTETGWAAQLDERRASMGATAVDALSQVAVVASFEASDAHD